MNYYTCAPPTSIRKLKLFIGIFNLYGLFIDDCAVTLLPLTALLNAKKAKSSPISLSEELLATYELIKKTIAVVPLLAHQAPDAALSLSGKASGCAFEALMTLPKPWNFLRTKQNLLNEAIARLSVNF